MKLSLSSSAVSPYLREGIDPREVYETFRATGFTCMDFEIASDMIGENPEENGASRRALLDSCGLTVTQSHAPMPNPFRTPDSFEPALRSAEGALRFCKGAGFAHTVVHPGAREGNTRKEFFENNVKFYRSLIPTMEATGVGVLIENIGHYMDPYFLWSAEDILELLAAVDHPLFSVCWDVGHANHFEYLHVGGSPYDTFQTLGDKLTAIHAHENVGFFPDPRQRKRVDMHMMPYCSGYSTVNWDAVLQGLKDAGYKGTFNFESNTPAPLRNTPEFRYNGQVVRTLEKVPLRVWKSVTTSLYEIGRFMLESYGLYEE
ncbi:MAG: sugar phosphate isomerase/epimerase [Clostridia bacterium]|nr:sugar phosphate isomerase/epimerase [Clostridia bacterium]